MRRSYRLSLSCRPCRRSTSGGASLRLGEKRGRARALRAREGGLLQSWGKVAAVFTYPCVCLGMCLYVTRLQALSTIFRGELPPAMRFVCRGAGRIGAECLCCSDNQVGDQGGEAVATSLLRLTGLTSLNLRSLARLRPATHMHTARAKHAHTRTHKRT